MKSLVNRAIRRPTVAVLYGTCMGATLPILAPVASPTGVLWLTGFLVAGHTICAVAVLWFWHKDSLVLILSQNRLWWGRYISDRDFVFSSMTRQAPLLLIGSGALIGATVPAVIWGLQPLVWTLVLNLNKQRWSCSDRALGAFVMGFVGCAFTVMAQPSEIKGNILLMTIGCFLALSGTVLDGLGACNLAWGYKVSSSIVADNSDDLLLTGSLLANLLGCGVGAITAIVLALATDGNHGNTTTLVAIGLFSIPWSFATYGWRSAGTFSKNSSVFVLGSAIPAVTVGYAALLGLLEDINLLWLSIGVTMVIIASTVGIREARHISPVRET